MQIQLQDSSKMLPYLSPFVLGRLIHSMLYSSQHKACATNLSWDSVSKSRHKMVGTDFHHLPQSWTKIWMTPWRKECIHKRMHLNEELSNSNRSLMWLEQSFKERPFKPKFPRLLSVTLSSNLANPHSTKWLLLLELHAYLSESSHPISILCHCPFYSIQRTSNGGRSMSHFRRSTRLKLGAVYVSRSFLKEPMLGDGLLDRLSTGSETSANSVSKS